MRFIGVATYSALFCLMLSSAFAGTREIQSVGIGVNVGEAKTLLPYVENITETFEATKALSTSGDILPLMSIVSEGFETSFSSQSIAAFSALFEAEMIPEGESQHLLKVLQVAVGEVHAQGTTVPLYVAIAGQLDSMTNNPDLTSEIDLALEELRSARQRLINDILSQSPPDSDWAGVLAFLPELNGPDRANSDNRHGCWKYAWFIPFYPAPPLKQTFVCANDDGGSTTICSKPVSGCRKCADENVCLTCCAYFERDGFASYQGRCELNCGDAYLGDGIKK